jgi:hypothetical protein
VGCDVTSSLTGGGCVRGVRGRDAGIDPPRNVVLASFSMQGVVVRHVALLMGGWMAMCTFSACSSDEEDGSANEAPPPAPYAPASAATQPPLPPGAGPRPKTDASTPMDAGQDVQQDVQSGDTGSDTGSE